MTKNVGNLDCSLRVSASVTHDAMLFTRPFGWRLAYLPQGLGTCMSDK